MGRGAHCGARRGRACWEEDPAPNREGQSEWRMDVPDSRAGLAPPGCHDCESGGLWWLDPGHDPMTMTTRRPDFARLRLHLYDAPLRRSCCSRCYADCRPRFRLGSGGGLYSAHNTFFHWCRTPSSSDPPRLRFVASTSSALPRLCPGASCASSNREFVLKKLCPKSPWVYTVSFAYALNLIT